jgi:hypothetical protein
LFPQKKKKMLLLGGDLYSICGEVGFALRGFVTIDARIKIQIAPLLTSEVGSEAKTLLPAGKSTSYVLYHQPVMSGAACIILGTFSSAVVSEPNHAVNG